MTPVRISSAVLEKDLLTRVDPVFPTYQPYLLNGAPVEVDTTIALSIDEPAMTPLRSHRPDRADEGEACLSNVVVLVAVR